MIHPSPGSWNHLHRIGIQTLVLLISHVLISNLTQIFPLTFNYFNMGFPGDSVVKNLPANVGDSGSPGVRNGNPLHYSCLENSMDRRAWWAMGLKESDMTEWAHMQNEDKGAMFCFVC